VNGGVLGWLAGATLVFVLANSTLKSYANQGGLPILLAALAMFCLGNWLMVRVMRDSGLGLAVALSGVFQLVALTLIAVVFFGERPTPLQIAGILLGIVAATMIVWPQGGGT
jgi:drug/metabolite transporter (DMT)-like permease